MDHHPLLGLSRALRLPPGENPSVNETDCAV